jgi:hypothetical protein
MPMGAEKELEDILLTRYANCVIAKKGMNQKFNSSIRLRGSEISIYFFYPPRRMYPRLFKVGSAAADREHLFIFSFFTLKYKKNRSASADQTLHSPRFTRQGG